MCQKTYDVEVEEVTEPGSFGPPEYLYHCSGINNIAITDDELYKGIRDGDIKILC